MCTLLKSGGGFLPLQRFDKAHTAFRVVVRRFDFASNLQKHTQNHKQQAEQWCKSDLFNSNISYIIQ